MGEIEIVKEEKIQSKIITLRGLQVILDRDLASFYGTETKVLNQAVKRNLSRFPQEFMFQITLAEFELLRSQFVTSNVKGGRRYLPYVFTEPGVAMLASVLKSETAIKMSIQVIKAFVSMRRFLAANANIFYRLDYLEKRQIESDDIINQILDAIEKKEILPKQGLFFDGQIFDAYVLLSEIIRSANQLIRIIDSYIDDTILTLLLKRNEKVEVRIYSNKISKQMKEEVTRHNAQYPEVIIYRLSNAHDRFIVIDDKVIYHMGASLKDLGKKWFAFSKLEYDGEQIIERLRKIEEM
ncbi:MAG: ORF6N domain-containing protein [Candidatus Cloacimonetes bacterium]|nr:ORF6N domain-containing protein [Candidatus Cloacimonadota bacterium]